MSTPQAGVSRPARKNPDNVWNNRTSSTIKQSPLTIDRANCLRLIAPPTTTLESVAIALNKQYPGIKGVQPMVINNNIIIQLSKETDIETFKNKSLNIGNATFNFNKLYNSYNSNLIQFTVKNLFHGDGGLLALESHINSTYGKIIRKESPFFKNTSTYTGEVIILIDADGFDSVPSASIELDRGDYKEHLSVTINGRTKQHCHYCKSTTHVRKDCTTAPACRTCTSHAHPTTRCTTTPPVPVIPAASAPTRITPTPIFSLPQSNDSSNAGLTTPPRAVSPLFFSSSSPNEVGKRNTISFPTDTSSPTSPKKSKNQNTFPISTEFSALTSTLPATTSAPFIFSPSASPPTKAPASTPTPTSPSKSIWASTSTSTSASLPATTPASPTPATTPAPAPAPAPAPTPAPATTSVPTSPLVPTSTSTPTPTPASTSTSTSTTEEKDIVPDVNVGGDGDVDME